VKTKGFTFIELMISIAIIAVIVAFALPYYAEYVDEAKIRKTYMNLDAFKKTIDLYKIDANNTRKSENRMRYDNWQDYPYNNQPFTLRDLVEYKYTRDLSRFANGWGEPFSIIKRPSGAMYYSLYVITNIYTNNIKMTREVFIGVQDR
jgi:prepilin-type N-terminal cleavage/methylation domain-containing protein